MRKEARQMKAMGIYRGPKRQKTMHVPNLYPYKRKMIESIENKKKTLQRMKMLEKLSLKSKAKTNLSVVKEDPALRVAKFIKDNEMKEESKFIFLIIPNFFRSQKIQKIVHERI